MVKIVKIVTISTLLTLLTIQSFAQERRGEGVGALLDRRIGASVVTVTNGKTAPRAEVIVENRNHEAHAVAQLDARGIFNFSFRTDDVGALSIYAFDDLGQTNPVSLSGTTFDNHILPPTIASDGYAVTTTSVSFLGFSYPRATITLVPISDTGYTTTLTSVSHETTGRWDITFLKPPPGNYTATAIASFGGITSEKSHVIEFQVPGLVPIPKTVQELVEKLPESAKTTVDITSKALIVPTIVAAAPSLSSLWYYLVRLLIGVRSFFYVAWKKRRAWGVVYDGLTKYPISDVIVRLYRETGELVETEVTSKTGAFSFLPLVGRYRISVAKPGYLFPSVLVKSRSDGEYHTVYHGEVFEIKRVNATIHLSIPIDEKARAVITVVDRLRLFIRTQGFRLEFVAMVLGLVFSLISYSAQPNTLNQLILGFYGLMLITAVVKAIQLGRHWGLVIDEAGKPTPLVSLSLLEAQFNRPVQRRLTDQAGRYQFVAPRGTYSVLVTSDDWELVATKKTYDGRAVRVTAEKDLVKPTIVVRKKTG